MRDKLIDILKSAPYGYKSYEEYADYLLANGVIVPFAECGTDIYGAYEWYTESVFKGTLISFSIQLDGLWFYCRYSNGLNMWHKGEDLGKTVFLTKEQAEKALAERKEQ